MAEKLKGRAAFDCAYAEFTDTVYRVAYHNTSNFTDAEDVTQEVFMKLLESGKGFQSEEHLKAWLIRVTVNLCHNLARKNKRVTSLDENLPAPEQTESPLEYVRKLPENYRNAIYLHYYEGYTAKEIGQILGAGQNTVLSWLSRGRELLKKEMIGGFEDE